MRLYLSNAVANVHKVINGHIKVLYPLSCVDKKQKCNDYTHTLWLSKSAQFYCFVIDIYHFVRLKSVESLLAGWLADRVC